MKDVERLLKHYYRAEARDLHAPRDLWERVSKNLGGESKSLLKRWLSGKGPWFTRWHVWREVLEQGATLSMLALFAFLAITTLFFIRSRSRLMEPGVTPVAAPALTPQPTLTPTPAPQPIPITTPVSPRIGGFAVVQLDSETLGLVMNGSVETLEMAVFGTIGGLVLALPLALVAIAMGRAGRILMWPFAYGLQVIPALILAVFAVIIFGVGLRAGIAALAVSGGGTFAWFLIRDLGAKIRRASSIETSSRVKGVIDNFRVAGPVIVIAITEQWQANMRNAVIIGIVGGGGIGGMWWQWIRLLEFHKVGTSILAVIVLVALADSLAALARWLTAAKAKRFQ